MWKEKLSRGLVVGDKITSADYYVSIDHCPREVNAQTKQLPHLIQVCSEPGELRAPRQTVSNTTVPCIMPLIMSLLTGQLLCRVAPIQALAS